MSIYKGFSGFLGMLLWTEVVCSQCGASMAGEFVRHGRRHMRMIKEEMVKCGWVVVNGEVLCVDCKPGAVKADGIELPTPMKGRV